MLVLPQNLSVLSRLTARQEGGRYAMGAVLLQDTDDGCYQVIATDGRRLAVVDGPCTSDDYPPSLEGVTNGGNVAMIPSPDWMRILRTVKPRDKQRDKAFAVIGPQQTTFAIGYITETVPHVEGRYPDWPMVFEGSRSLCSVNVDAKLLGDLLLAAQAFTEEGSNLVVLHYQGKGKPLLLVAKNAEGQRFQAALMPLT